MKILKNSLLLIALISAPTWAKTGDTEQPIQIDSATQKLDMASNTVTFTGDVVLTQGSILMKADHVVVTRSSGEAGAQVMEAFGNPATFQQQQDNGKLIHGEAEKLRYQVSEELLEMFTKALLVQEDSQISGDKISYRIDKRELVAKGDKKQGERVTTILTPAKKTETPKEITPQAKEQITEQPLPQTEDQ
ncbi:lipopolysaccharide transport periplasmic protein LptA [Vibrio sp. SS-MA-C1-2]|uniref:lipopolysaccharide transport periplasmic protein LptA n=1 Tax=Vibrio sp. SS-MA-C1-2 TaxID=2908646 RepID=UPI001F22479C|nr:lipopolysaccharide transport periplasmic protein LptA [Vibrio sp. SS-MA-C1-2]UJF19585.1 lipopolysaccharide transport periplasmic protein LptA [Vibrio sp. SS-MA-C1-2]